MSPAVVIYLVIIGALLLLTAAMSASEFALFSLKPEHLRELKERGGKNGIRVMELLAKPRRLLATILISSAFVNMGIIVLSTFIVTQLWDVAAMPHYLAITVPVYAVAVLIVLVGEVIPKVYSSKEPRRIAKRMSGMLITLPWLFRPLCETLLCAPTFI